MLVALVAGGGAFVGVMKFRERDAGGGRGRRLSPALLLPFCALLFMRKRRHGKFAAQFPDAMDIIVRSLRAGHPVPVAVALVAQEMPDPIGTEFGIAADEVTYGADVETAMRNLYFRVGQEDLPLFVTAVSIQGSTGGNLSEILSNLSARDPRALQDAAQDQGARGRRQILGAVPVRPAGRDLLPAQCRGAGLLRHHLESEPHQDGPRRSPAHG